MHKNIIFDCGNVLHTFSYDILLNKYIGSDQNDRKIVFEKVFNLWAKQDAGMPSIDFYNEAIKEVPERLHQGIYNIIFYWDKEIILTNGMDKLIYKLKNKNHKIYLLSNMPETFAHNHSKIKYLDDFDDLIFSYDVKMVKPNSDIYLYLLKKHGLKPKDCLFIDDSIDNINAAKNLGIDTYLFSLNNIDVFYDYMNNNEL